MQPDMRRNILLELENIGCLKHLKLELKPGVNIIKAPNASGKTSLIRGLTSMFSGRIPPAHILALDAAYGKVRIQYDGRIYERHFRRTPTGQVGSYGDFLPFADHRAFDAAVALAETGIVHKVTGGGKIFREYLENLSYGSYYSAIISAAQELIDEISRELAGPSFEKFEMLPLLLTELTDLHIKRDQIKEEIESVKARHEDAVRALAEKMEQKKAEFSKEEMRLSELENSLTQEEERERQLLSFLEVADGSSKVAVQLKEGILNSKNQQQRFREEIARQNKLLQNLRQDIVKLENQLEQKKTKPVEGMESLEKSLNDVNKAIILKEEEIQHAERFPQNDPRYPGRLVIEVRKELLRKIEWLNKVTEHFQEKYMRRMTSARLRFNSNVARAFEELGLKRFENIFLDQDFVLHIVRENGVRQPVETLSASEKLTVSLILMLAAKETFLPDFPLFVIDELTLSYDPARFKQIVNYVAKRVPYVIVTCLASEMPSKPEVVYAV